MAKLRLWSAQHARSWLCLSCALWLGSAACGSHGERSTAADAAGTQALAAAADGGKSAQAEASSRDVGGAGGLASGGSAVTGPALPAPSGSGAGALVGGAGSSAGVQGAAGATAQAGSAGGTRDRVPTAGANDHEPCPAAPAPCRILPFGDSITYGIGFSGGYRVELFRRAVAAGQHITFLGSLSNGPDLVDGEMFPKQNEGHSGWKIAQLQDLIPSPALEPLPDIVLLMIGTNDIAQRDNLSAAPDRLNSLLDRLNSAAPKALLVLAQITPLSNASSTQAIETYNAALEGIVEKRSAAGESILLVDMYTGFPTSELGDGVHPNEQGYARMAATWYAAIGGLLH